MNSTAPETPRAAEETNHGIKDIHTLADVLQSGSQAPSPYPPGTRALPVLSWPLGRGNMELDGCDGAQLAGLSLARPLSQILKTERSHRCRTFLRSEDVSQLTQNTMTFCATDLAVFRKGDGEGVPAPVVSRLQADKERLPSSPVLIEIMRTS